MDSLAPSDVFRQRLKELRLRRGWTQEDLGQRLSRLGFPLDRTAIAKIEGTGTTKRGVSLDEALAIAAALDVSPLALLTPSDADPATVAASRNAAVGQVEVDDTAVPVSVVPAATHTPAQVRAWIRGVGVNAAPEVVLTLHEDADARSAAFAFYVNTLPHDGWVPDVTADQLRATARSLEMVRIDLLDAADQLVGEDTSQEPGLEG